MGVALIEALSAGAVIGVTTNLSVGPNNLMMLREGVVRGRIGIVSVTVCASYAVLILGAAAAAGLPVTQVSPSMRTMLVWCGVVLLAIMALRAFMAAFRPPATPRQGAAVASLIAALLVIWINPLTYLELFFAPAMVAQNYSGLTRTVFFACLLGMTTIGCCLYPQLGNVFGQRWIGKRSTRALDIVSGLMLAGATALTLRPLLV